MPGRSSLLPRIFCGVPTARRSSPSKKAGPGSLPRWSTGTLSVWAGTLPRPATGLQPSSRFPWRSRAGSDQSVPMPPVDCRSGWIMALNTFRTTSRTRSSSGGSHRVSLTLPSRKPTAWQNAFIGLSKSRSSMAELIGPSRSFA